MLRDRKLWEIHSPIISYYTEASVWVIFGDVSVSYEQLMSYLTHTVGNHRMLANDEKPEHHDQQIHRKISILLE